MHREPLLRQLEVYGRAFPRERAIVEQFASFVEGHTDCLLRSCRPGHVTGAAWILSDDRRHFLLTHHRKLDRWLQLGGHADGEAEVHKVALREAREESGMQGFRFAGADPRPFDLDVHAIPATATEPAHLHFDVRFLLIAAPDQELQVSDESYDVRWFPVRELERVVSDESVLRMGRKAAALLR